MTSSKLPRDFYEREDVVSISRDLIGKVLCTQVDGVVTKGRIVETEAYNGRTDKACHAHGNTRTPRTEVMYGPPGHAYIYLCYGIHHLFNVVTNQEGLADAVLIRAVEPLVGTDYMMDRRAKGNKPVLTNGPGKLSQALGISTDLDQTDLMGNIIWIEEGTERVNEEQIKSSKRIGVEYAGEDAKRTWRFTLSGSKWISKKPDA